MKKFRFFRFTKPVQAIVLAMLMASFFSSCKDKDKPEPEPEKSGEKAMTKLKVFDADDTEFTAQLKSGDNQTWQFMPTLGYETDKLEKAKITFEVSPRATADPISGAEVDLREPVDVTVTAENETTIVYTIEMVEGTSSEAKIEEFSVSIGEEEFPGVINAQSLEITVELSFDIWDSRDEAIANITHSLGATTDPDDGAIFNFVENEVINIVVTAHNKVDKNTYKVKAVRPSSSAANIVSIIFTVGGVEIPGIIDDDNSKILVGFSYSQKDNFQSIAPTIKVSPGASVSAESLVPQDFTEPVEIVVTALDGTEKTWTVVSSLNLYDGPGFTDAEEGVAKTFDELGFPGQYNNFGLTSIEYGDIVVYHSYCGDNIVLMSRVYIERNDDDYSVLVVDKTTLNPAGNLNLGSISVSDLKMITSDYKGTMVGAIVNGGETEFFYWKKTTDAPTSVGKINLDIRATTALCGWETGASANNFQVAGDITGNAWITSFAPASDDGKHYRIKVTGGQLASNYSTVTTGFPSNDSRNFQMISPLDDFDEPNFVVGDGEENSAKCYIIDFAGTDIIETMPALWNENSGFPGILEASEEAGGFWGGTGTALAMPGARRPVVSALPINGKTYITVTSGTNWWPSAAVLVSDLSTWAHDNLTHLFALNVQNALGSWVDWYCDDTKQEAYLAIWHERYGMRTYKMTW